MNGCPDRDCSGRPAHSRTCIVEWVDPRWWAEDFLNLYDQAKDLDPDIPEAFSKWAHNARLWLRATEPSR